MQEGNSTYLRTREGRIIRKGNGSIPPKQIGEQKFRLVEVIVKEFTTIPTKISSV